VNERATYLDDILAAKRAELDRLPPNNVAESALRSRVAALPPPRDFVAALRSRPKPAAIAEFKRASPSEGTIRADADPRHVAALYVDAGAACISVLCDARFGGSLDDLRLVRSSVSVPLLCKDFILSRRQLLEAREAGADAPTRRC
jgi:indole-3-glycerol phosphate synthase